MRTRLQIAPFGGPCLRARLRGYAESAAQQRLKEGDTVNIRYFVTTVFLVVSLTGCFQTIPQYRAHYTFVQSPQAYAPKKVVVLPVDVIIKEVTAGGVSEEVPDWSRQGSANVRDALNKYFRAEKKKRIQLIEMPKLADRDLENVKQHLALYRRVAGAVYDKTYSQMPWAHKIQRFDYTLGNGLKGLAERTGADSAIIVVGQDEVSTAGRKIAAFFLDSVAYGHSFLSGAIVNLNTGDILWFNYAFQYKSADLRKPEDALTLVERTFDQYPGIEQYKALRLVQK